MVLFTIFLLAVNIFLIIFIIWRWVMAREFRRGSIKVNWAVIKKLEDMLTDVEVKRRVMSEGRIPIKSRDGDVWEFDFYK